MRAFSANDPLLDKLVCPFHRKRMSKVCSTCPMWIAIRGIDPNSGEEVDGMNCAISWGPMLMIENSQQQKQTTAAVESFRNEVARQAREPAAKAVPWLTQVMAEIEQHTAPQRQSFTMNGQAMIEAEGQSDDDCQN